MADFITSNLTKSVGDKTLFDKLSFIIHPLDRIGLLGMNGAGKTTLLDTLAGVMGFDGDQSPFEVPSNFRINYLTQEPDFSDNDSILEAILDESLPQARAIKCYELALAKLTEVPENVKLQEDLAKAEAEITQLDAWNIESEIKTILTKFSLPDESTKIGVLSGGQKRRVQVAQALVNPADLLLLDEPTNHLDVEVIDWLQNYLTASKKTLLFVTHDRYFLDHVATRVFELENAKLLEYKGNYQDYLEQKAIRETELSANRHKAEQLYKSELVWIRKSPQARTTKQQARINRFEDLSGGLKNSQISGDEMKINLTAQRLGKKVIQFEKAGFSYPNRPIFSDLDLIVQAKSRIGIVGDNGVGKSTLLNLINGELSLTSGSFDIGETVRIGYFSQEIRGISDKDEDKRIINFLEEIASASQTSDGQNVSVVDLLEQFLFPRARHGEFIRKLSGGEKKRLYLLKILLSRPNVLLLDEPTNDLDITTLTVLENFLQSFNGAVLTVSHDRYFQDKVSQELLAFENGKIQHVFSSYSDYLATKSIENSESVDKNVTKSERRGKSEKVRLSFAEKKDWETIEDEIAQIENELSILDNEMMKNGADFGKLSELQKAKDEKEKVLAEKYERWEYLSEKVLNEEANK
ncbi:MAG: ABC-F family ATP-binding cassette domain-containing protein [Streptococcaceae bacterium]|jgi:ATP-binding cassette subfamily F protein uup|nr:ABC-F family ATP-binding cassette domain-containing protein [Streptococcaceae bacterium]